MTNVLLIDDDNELGEMLTEYLAGDGFTTTCITDGRRGVELATSGDYEVVVLDVMLPDISGTEVLRQIRLASDVPVLMLTAKGSELDRVVGLELGADDYVAKPYFPRELIARLRALLRRKLPSNSKPMLSLGKLELSEAKREVSWNGVSFELTTKEFNLLMALLRAEDAVATKDDLSKSALGRKRAHYDRSVDVHIVNLRRKLHSSTDGNIEIETIRGVGYRLKVD